MGKIRLSLQEEGRSKKMIAITDEEKAYAAEFAKQIDVTNLTMVLQYGSSAQKKVSDFSDSALRSVPDHDLKEISEDLEKLISALEQFGKDYKNREKLKKTFKSLYDKAETQTTETARRLEIHRSSLLRHMNLLEQHYETCLDTVKEFDLYIYAGQLCLEEGAKKTQELAAAAKQSGSRQDLIIANDYKDCCSRLDRRLRDLGVTRELPVQTAVYIRTIQSCDEVMAENLRRLNANAFPLWKQRMVLSLGYTSEQDASDEMFYETNNALISSLKQMTAVMKTSLEDRQKAQAMLEKK